jgi:prevent-host-death family protein
VVARFLQNCRLAVLCWTVLGYNDHNDYVALELTMSESYDVAEAKSRFSELLNRASYGRERFLIRKRGRPAAAIVSVEDLARLEGAAAPKPRGLLAAAGLMADSDEWEAIMDDVIASRADSKDREVTLE